MLGYTKKELDTLTSERLTALIEYAGGDTHLSRMLGVSPQLVYRWKTNGRISKKGVELVRRNGAFPYYFTAPGYLRPDWDEA